MSEKGVLRLQDNVITRREEKSLNTTFFNDFDKVFVNGIIEEEFEFSHQEFHQRYYQTRIKVARASGTEDLVPILVTDFLIGEKLNHQSLKGKWLEVAGEFMTFNRIGEDGCRHLKQFVIPTEVNICNSEYELKEDANSNSIYLDGYICKKPTFRSTPFGRQITDLLIAVNNSHNKSSYIPCIAWGRLAKWAGKLEVGDRVQLYGRIQSREYFKKLSEDGNSGKYKTAYEISIIVMQKV